MSMSEEQWEEYIFQRELERRLIDDELQRREEEWYHEKMMEEMFSVPIWDNDRIPENIQLSNN